VYLNNWRRVAQSTQCLTRDWTTGVQSPAEAKDFSFGLCVQAKSEVHPASYLMGSSCYFPGGKARPGRDSDHSQSSAAEVKNEYLLSPESLDDV
jgi:hypothetical protein